MKQNKAFSLAEVIITLVVIAIIAAFTIVDLVQNSNQLEYVVGYKRAIAVLNHAIISNYAFEGRDAGDYDSKFLLSSLFTNYVRVIKTEKTGAAVNPNIFYTQDGLKFEFTDFQVNCSSTGRSATPEMIENGIGKCATVIIDVNGDKFPNQLSTGTNFLLREVSDQFEAYIYPERVVPFGIYLTLLNNYGSR